MIKNILTTVLMVSIIFSCKNDDDDCCKNIESVISINVKDSQNIDLLDPNSEAIDINLIKIFYVDNYGILQEVNNSQLDNNKGYNVILPDSNSSFYEIQVQLNVDYFENNVSYTYIEWSAEDIDKLKTQFNLSNGNIIANKIWLNDEIVWESNIDGIITIIK